VQKKFSRPLLIFYILVAYVFIQFCWWAYSLVQLNSEIYNLKLEILRMAHEGSPELLIEKANLDQKLRSRIWMVLGEGSVFFILLAIGVWQTLQSFKKEVSLARQQKNFLLAVTHELKSPIASVKLYLQTLQKRELEREKQNEIVAKAIADTDRLGSLVENLLLATKIDRSDYMLHFEELNLSDLLSQIAATHPENKRLQTEIQQGIKMQADKLAFTSIVVNLLENALKYSEQNVTVKLQNDKNILLSIIDSGAGIADDEKQKVFEKFYRIGNEDTRKSKGTGLGLYIVKNLVERHNGTIHIRNNQPGGSIFEIEFPL
jgi:two-component system phosphate regulon sensor histidine kinase PhoR